MGYREEHRGYRKTEWRAMETYTEKKKTKLLVSS